MAPKRIKDMTPEERAELFRVMEIFGKYAQGLVQKDYEEEQRKNPQPKKEPSTDDFLKQLGLNSKDGKVEVDPRFINLENEMPPIESILPEEKSEDNALDIDDDILDYEYICGGNAALRTASDTLRKLAIGVKATDSYGYGMLNYAAFVVEQLILNREEKELEERLNSRL